MDAIERLPKAAWTGGIGQHGESADNAFVADLTGLLDLGAWQEKVPGLRIIMRDEPLHPRYRKRATEREKQLGRRTSSSPPAPAAGRSRGLMPATAPTSMWRTT
jgi:hypothetical protein